MCCSFPPNVTGSTFLQQLADDTSGRGGCGLALCSHNCLFPAALFTFCAPVAVHKTGGSVLRWLHIPGNKQLTANVHFYFWGERHPEPSSRCNCATSTVVPLHSYGQRLLALLSFWGHFCWDENQGEVVRPDKETSSVYFMWEYVRADIIHASLTFMVVPYTIKCCLYLLYLYRVFKKTSPNSKV